MGRCCDARRVARPASPGTAQAPHQDVVSAVQTVGQAGACTTLEDENVDPFDAIEAEEDRPP
eukprot:7460284-Pyramimonas_sp.AAC.1